MIRTFAYLTILSIIFLSSFIQSKIKPLSPTGFTKIFQQQEIPYEIANFGKVPYGRKMKGRIIFQEQNKDGCKPFKELESYLDQFSSILFVQRGNCHFVDKARNAQNVGAKAIIVYDNRQQWRKFVMIDDGTGQDILIPLIMVEKEIGQLINSYLNQNKDKQNQPKISIYFEVKTVSFVDYTLNFSPVDHDMIDVIGQLKQFHEKLQKKNLISMQPHYQVQSCTGCGKQYYQNYCIAEGKYCALNSYVSLLIYTPQQILDESLRGKCIYRQYHQSEPTKWWRYQQSLKSIGYDYGSQEKIQKAFKLSEIDMDKIKKCMEGSYSNEGKTNKIFDQQIKYWNNQVGHLSPQIVADKQAYRGDLVAEDIIQFLCAIFTKKPDQCLTNQDGGTSGNGSKSSGGGGGGGGGGISVGWIVLIIIFLILVNIVIIYCYRRRSKREMNDRLHHEVNSAVSAYFALSEGGAPPNLKDG